jgi:hypothetical protein
MATLSIDLQEGFEGEEVIVRVDGREAARCRGVRTNRMLGLADSLAVQVPEDKATIEIAVPSRHLERRVEVRPGETPYLGVSLSSGQINLLPYPEPFGYA